MALDFALSADQESVAAMAPSAPQSGVITAMAIR